MSSSSASRIQVLIVSASEQIPTWPQATMKSSSASRKWMLESQRVSSASKIRFSASCAFPPINLKGNHAGGAGQRQRSGRARSAQRLSRQNGESSGSGIVTDVDLGLIDVPQIFLGKHVGGCAA